MNKRIVMFVLLFVLGMSVTAASAQGIANLVYGGSATGTLSAEAPLNLYIFSGNAGDLVTAEVIGLEPGMSPTVSLLTPSQQVLSGGAVEQLQSGSRTASITRFLPSAGAYTLLVGGSPGQYLVLLSATPALTSSAPLSIPASTSITLGPDAPQQVLTVANSSPNPVALSLAGGSAQAAFSASVYNADGQPVAQFSGAVGDMCVGIPGGTGNFMVLLSGEDGVQPLNLSLALADGTCGSAAASAPQPVQQPVQPVQLPAATPEVSGSGSSGGQQAAACTVTSGTNVNVRSGPGTGYGVLTQLQGGQQAAVVGTSEGGWVVIQVGGIQGFVSLSVVSTFGNCSNLPFVPAPQGQQQQPPTATPLQQQLPTATAPVQQQQQPTATPTATFTLTPTALADLEAPQQQQQPTATPTATNTATAPVPVAPPDSNYALNVQLDGNASVSDFVSYPEGDTEDVVSYAVNGLNNSVALPGGRATLTLTFSCFGTGTQFINFIVDGQARSCGQSYQRIVNADSRTGAVRIQATGGQGTYVQWVVTAAAPRLN